MSDSTRRAVSARVRSPRRSRGQSLVELALILPILMLILLGTIDFGRVLFSWIAVHNAAREAAAHAIWHPTDTGGIAQRAHQEANVQGQRGEGALSVTVTCRNSATQAVVPCNNIPVAALGGQVTVTVSRPFTFFTPFIGGLFPGFSLEASATGFHMSPVAGVAPAPGATPTPTPAPGATPTPTPAPGATPTPTPTPTLAPTPTPTPALCTVPNFEGRRRDDNPSPSRIWTNAGFVGANLTNTVEGNREIRGQSLGAGTRHPCQTATITLN